MIHVAAIFVAVAAFQTPARPQVPVDKHGLPLPFGLEHERVNAGDALAPYAYLKKHQKGYEASEMWKSTFFEALATYESYIGLHSEAIADFARSQPGSTAKKPPLTKNPLEGYKAMSAVDFLLERAETTNCLMIGESHHMPQTRVIGIQLLKGLWDRGYRYLAAETFAQPTNPEFDKEMNTRRYPLVTTGFYSREPVLGELIRTAQRLGFKLVPYEATNLLRPDPKNPNAAQQSREDQQAANLKRIYDEDPKAKVLVWNGYSHNYEIKLDDGLVLMGARFKEITGIDPYTVSQYMTSERATPDAEHPTYRYAADHALIEGPTVFVDADGKPFRSSEGNDCAVFLPRTIALQGGRSDWLRNDLGRTFVSVPENLVQGGGMHLAQAFYEGEPANAVPIDQILIPAGSKSAVLALPIDVKVWIRVIDEAGRESERHPMRVQSPHRDSPEDLAAITHPELRLELERRVKIDQAARFAIIDAIKRDAQQGEMKTLIEACAKIDQEGTAWLKSVVDRSGWPCRSMVGKEGSHHAWLLVQHADLDKPFQRRCLDLMKALVERDEVSKSDFAYLTDRVLIGEGKKQLYGTQCTGDGHGRYKPLPVEDPKNLDKRRAAVGLEPMKAYLKLMEQVNGPSRKPGSS